MRKGEGIIKEKWVCKKCKKPFEVFRTYFIANCVHSKIGADLEKVGIKIK